MSSDVSFYRAKGKRLLDILLASILLLVLSPLWILIVIAIVVGSRGGAHIMQERIGIEGRSFRLLKFRSMFIEDRASDISLQAQRLANDGILLKIESDPRITPIGKYLRRYSLDELPQLVNILRGEMSFVGPRPLLPFMVAPYPEESRLRSVVRPGLTGYWQIHARSQSHSLLQMMEYDTRYVRDISLLNDLRTMLSTIPLVVKGTGAK